MKFRAPIFGLITGLTLAFFHAASAELISPLPIGYFCPPYTHSYEEGKHYLSSGGSCTYLSSSFPSSAKRFTVLFKGTVGNATVVASHSINLAATSTQRDSFTGASQDDDYFVLMYVARSGTDDHDRFGSYFTSGVGSPPTNTWGIIRFKYGSKPASEFDPVVIIPGILGSWEKDGELLLDPITYAYDNLIETLRSNGYVEGKTLFPFPYDWRQSNATTGDLLKKKILEIRGICHCSYVDIIAHSMGGLVARSYAEGNGYAGDIDQLFFLGTPHLGAPKDYAMWEGGKIVGESWFGGLIRTRIFLQEAKEKGYDSIFSYIHDKPIPSVQELLPLFSYLAEDNLLRNYPDGYPENPFLVQLRENVNNLYNRGISIYNVAGSANNTVSIVHVQSAPDEAPMWEHGKYLSYETGEGDGTVPRRSISDLFTIDKTFTATHTAIPTTAEAWLFAQMNGRVPNITIEGKAMSDYFFLVQILSPADILVTDPSGKRMGTDPVTGVQYDEIEGAFYTGNETDTEFITIPNPIPGTYKVTLHGTGNGSYTLVTSSITENGDLTIEKDGEINDGATQTTYISLGEDKTIAAPPGGRIIGSVFVDKDKDGMRDGAIICSSDEDACSPADAESGFQGATVAATPLTEDGSIDLESGRTATSTLTREDGAFSFDFEYGELGRWQISAATPDGYALSSATSTFETIIASGDSVAVDTGGTSLTFGFATHLQIPPEDSSSGGNSDLSSAPTLSPTQPSPGSGGSTTIGGGGPLGLFGLVVFAPTPTVLGTSTEIAIADATEEERTSSDEPTKMPARISVANASPVTMPISAPTAETETSQVHTLPVTVPEARKNSESPFFLWILVSATFYLGSILIYVFLQKTKIK